MSEPPGHDIRDQHEDPARRVGECDTSLEEILQRRVPSGVRVVQSLGLLILAAVVAGLLMHAIVPAPGASPGPVLVLSNVSFGKVTVNGTLLSGPPPLVTTFRRGLNSLTLTAVPLRPRTCTVQWPEAQVQGVCDVRRDVRAPYHVSGRSVTPVALVELWFSGDDLPANVRERTLANISATLRAVPLRTTVPAGEYVATGLDADGQITSQRVATPLYADLVVTATSLDFIGDEFCADPGCVPVLPVATASWAVATSVSDQWQFTPLSGGQASRSALSPPAWSLRLVLRADPVNGWDVDQQRTEQLNGFGLPFALPATICRAGADVLAKRVTLNPYSLSVVSDHGLVGCELHLTSGDGASQGYYVWRFGVLLAADARAQVLRPDLPLVPPSALIAVGATSPAPT